ncbi:MAG: PpiC-type peptidyl-prolyl cis-trans isomerase [Bacteroidetes bacterium]|jgi:peptidyl-prolyl cis-trans isomerase D|nr:PpiC-type peptidyl-prolyl cis-trans isomerase [Bacteroidota bacterium]
MSSNAKNVQPTETKNEQLSTLELIRRRKGLLVGIVGLAILIFILENFFSFGSTLFGGGDSSTVGYIGGKKIDRNDFLMKVENQLNQIRQQRQSNDIDDQTRQQVIDFIWQQYVTDLVIKPQYDNVGLTVGDDEIYERVVANPVQSVIQQLSDPKTGQLNPQFAKPDGSIDLAKWKAAVMGLPPEQEPALKSMEDNVKNQRFAEKYAALIRKGLYTTSAEAKEGYKVDNTTLNVSIALKRFDAVSDSTVKVTDEDIQKYYTDHSYEFKNKETTRKIEYIAFNVVASDSDKIRIERDANRVAEQFKGKTAKEDSSFMQNESENGNIVIQDFTKKTMIVRDSSIFTAAPGTVFGPYNEGAYFKVYKLQAIVPVADSGNVRHILLAYQGAERSQATRTRDQAKKTADSLVASLKKGGNFDQMVELFSDDGGKKRPNINFSDTMYKSQLSQILLNVKDTNSWKGHGGNYGWIKAGDPNMAEAFVKGATEHNKGDIIVQESQFGYHIMEVLDLSKTSFTNYRVAQIFKPIVPSDETNQAIFAKANEFGGKNNTAESFDKAAAAQKLAPRLLENIKENSRQFPGLDNAKELVRWVYAANKGDVAIFSFNDKHIVAKLSGIRNRGTLPLEEVKDEVIAKVKIQKKGEMFLAEFKSKGTGKAEDIASKLGLEPKKIEKLMASGHNIEGIGHDDVIMGTAIGTKAGQTSKAIAGDNGVFVVTVNTVDEAPAPKDYKMQQREMDRGLGGRADMEAFNALMELAEIEDHTSKFD